MKLLLALALAVGTAAHLANATAAAAAPETRLEPVTDSYFGQAITDPYRWLEDLRAPDVRDWFTAQNAYTREVLDALPSRAPLRARIAALDNTDSQVRNAQWGGDLLFYEKRGPGEDRYQLFVRAGIDGAERLLVDPARFDANGQPAGINFFVPAPNGKRIAFGISLGGSEDATLRVVDVVTGREIGAAVPRMDIGDPASWRIDSGALFYTQLNAPQPGQDAVEKYRSARVFVRDFGGGADRPIFGRGLDESIALDPDDVVRVRSYLSSFAIATVQHGNDAEMVLYAAPLAQTGRPHVPWRRITRFEDGVTGFDVRGEWIYLTTNANAPRYRVVRWSLADSRPLALDQADVLLPQSARVITGLSVARDALYVQSMDGGYDRMQRLEFNVKLPPSKHAARGATRGAAALPKSAGIARASEIALPFDGTVEERVADPMRAGVLLRIAGWTPVAGLLPHRRQEWASGPDRFAAGVQRRLQRHLVHSRHGAQPRRDGRAGLDRLPAQSSARRAGAGPADGLRGVRDQRAALLPADDAGVARAGRRIRRRARARRWRIRQGMARRRPPREQAEHVARPHRRGGNADT